MTKKERAEKCLKWFKTLNVGDTITDVKHKRQNVITALTSNSVEVYLTKTSKKGINCWQWFDVDSLAYFTEDYL